LGDAPTDSELWGSREGENSGGRGSSPQLEM